MRVGYHPAVQRDVSGILHHYDGISARLGDAFWRELMAVIEEARLATAGGAADSVHQIEHDS